MKDLIFDTLLDTLKLCPFLFLSFAIIAYFELRFKAKSLNILNKTLKHGPCAGALLGVVPQCGFSVFAANLYSIGIITAGTLIAVFLSTSDELLPILISSNAPISKILQIILFKVIISIIAGYTLDFIIHDKKENETNVEICTDSCCDNGVLIPAIYHTFQTAIYILITTFIINICIYYIGEETIAGLLNNNNFFTPFIASLIGLIPNCAASVIITELYLNNIISFASCIAGLLTSSGVAIMVLFKVNKDCFRDNVEITAILYFVGVISGIILNLFHL